MSQGLERVLEIVYDAGALTTNSDMKPQFIAEAKAAILSMVPKDMPVSDLFEIGFNKCRDTILKNFEGGA